MNVLTYGEIMDGGSSVFHCVASVDDGRLIVAFQGVIRIDNPYRYLSPFLAELKKLLPAQTLTATTLDFVELRFCNSNGFYVIMDIVETVYSLVPGNVLVRRIQDDDWQQETLPILLNVDETSVSTRTRFEDVREI